MSWKTFFVLIIFVLLGVFVYFKIEVSGEQNTHFNQTSRFTLAAHPVLRSLLGLHNNGDARTELLSGQGTIAIEWFKPQIEDVDPTVLKQFADAVTRYTGRPTIINLAGALGDSTMPLADLKSFVLKADGEKPKGSTLLMLAFTKDYSPRPDQELSTTFEESSIVVSLDAHTRYLQGLGQELNNYLFSSLLRGFGQQIGMQYNKDSACIMAEPSGINGQPVENYGKIDPQDFCPAEQMQINQLKAQY